MSTGRALFAYTGQAANQISFSKGEAIKVVNIGSAGGWSKGTNTKGQTGYFPTDYVQLVSVGGSIGGSGMQQRTSIPSPTASGLGSLSGSSTLGGAKLKAKALYAFPGSGPNEMPLAVGQIVEVVRKGAPGGWCKGTGGAFPTDYVKFLAETEAVTLTPESGSIPVVSATSSSPEQVQSPTESSRPLSVADKLSRPSPSKVLTAGQAQRTSKRGSGVGMGTGDQPTRRQRRMGRALP